MILYFGYLNYGNFGDDLLLEIASRNNVNFQTLSSKDNLIEHFKKIKNAQKIVLLGGLFQDLTSIRSSLYYFLVVLFAKLLGKKIIFLATGIGPLKHDLTKFITELSYKLANQVSVRDNFSSNFLNKHKIKHELVKDLAFSLNYDESQVNKGKIPEGNYEIISINPYLSKIDIQEDSLEIICEVSQEPSAKNFIYTKDFNAHELIYLFKHHCKSLTTQRFHLAVLARIAGIEYSTTEDSHKVNQLKLLPLD